MPKVTIMRTATFVRTYSLEEGDDPQVVDRFCRNLDAEAEKEAAQRSPDDRFIWKMTQAVHIPKPEDYEHP